MDETYKGNMVYVGGSGPGNYTSIQQAIDDANNGDTVFIFDDSSPYCERIVIPKPITVTGESKQTTVIEGSDSGSVITVQGTFYVTISNLTIRKSGTDSGAGGIFIDHVDTVDIINNEIVDNNDFGIFVLTSTNVLIKGNTIGYNAADGVVVRDNSLYTTIEHNHIFHNGDKGIYLAANSHHSFIRSNIVTQNLYGIKISNSNFHTIYENIFLDNQHPVSSTETYQLDLGYPYGGNYWSQYSNHDMYHGPNQDLPGADGIGDTPYHINYVRDNYPLHNPKAGSLYGDAKGPYFAEVNQPIQFQGYAFGGKSEYTWQWEFGDGETSNKQFPEHSYTAIGHYFVTLNITDAEDTTISDTAQVFIVNAPGTDLFVSKTYTGDTPGWQETHFQTIQSAINVAGTGSTISVTRGTYEESLAIHRQVTLKGADRKTTVIKGPQDRSTVMIQANGVSIEEFTIMNAGDTYSDSAGLQIRQAEDVTVKQNIFKNNPKQAINVNQAQDCTITQNFMVNNDKTGVYIGAGSTNNMIAKNSIVGSKTGLAITAPSNTFSGNKILGGHVGISITGLADSNIVINNLLLANIKGIDIYGYYSVGSTPVIFSRNTFLFNVNGVHLEETSNNLFYENNFICTMSASVYVNSDNYWVHNYWKRPHLLPKVAIGLNINNHHGTLAGLLFDLDLRPALKPFITPIPPSEVPSLSIDSILEEYST